MWTSPVGPGGGASTHGSLTAVYVTVDDLYQRKYAQQKPVRRGAKPVLSDSEVLTLALVEQWRPDHNETAFVALVRAEWSAYFPRMLTQGAFNRRVRDLAGVLCRLGPDVATTLACLVGGPEYEVIDAVPVPLMRRCRGERHRLFAAEAQVGRGGSDRAWFYGCSLLDVVSPDGAITGWVLGPANTEGHWLAETLLRWRANPFAPPPTAEELGPVLDPRHRADRVGPTGPICGRLAVGIPQTAVYLGDGGFRGACWHQHWYVAYGARIVTTADPDLAQHPRLRRRYASARQVVETVHSLLVGAFGLVYPGARSVWGLVARIAAKVAALNITVLINALTDRPTFSLFRLLP